MENAKRTRVVFMVRHGQRKDHLPKEYPEYVGHPDSPLTPLGHSQASEAGKEIERRIKLLKSEFGVEDVSISIECSPFWRCLETSHAISKCLNVSKAQFNYPMGEWLAERLYKAGTPMPKLATQTMSITEVNSHFDTLEFSDNLETKSILVDCYPEEKDHVSERFLQGFTHIQQHLAKQEPGSLHV